MFSPHISLSLDLIKYGTGIKIASTKTHQDEKLGGNLNGSGPEVDWQCIESGLVVDQKWTKHGSDILTSN